MAIRIRIPAPLRPVTDGRTEVEAAGSTVRDVLADAESRFAGLSVNVLEDGLVRPLVSVYLNEQDIRYLAGLDTPVRDGDTIVITPAIAGSGRKH